MFPAFKDLSRCLAVVNGNFSEAYGLCKSVPILYFRVVLAFEDEIAKAEKKAAIALHNLNMVIQKATKPNRHLDPSKRKEINSAIKKFAIAECEGAAMLNNALKNKPNVGSNNYKAICNGMNTLAADFKALAESLSRVCGGDGFTFGAEADKTGTIQNLKKLSLTFRNTGQCIRDNKNLSPGSVCMGNACYAMSNQDNALVKSLNDLKSKKCKKQ